MASGLGGSLVWPRFNFRVASSGSNRRKYIYEKAQVNLDARGGASGDTLVLSGNRLYEEHADFEETCQARCGLS